MPTYTGDYLTRRERYQRLHAALKSERRSGFDSHWREIGDFLMPRRTRFWPGDRNKDNRRNQNIIDSTGRFSANTLASGLHAGLTSPARPWMKLTTPDAALAQRPNVKRWLYDVTERMLVVFATSNLYNVLPLVYKDIGLFATAGMAILPDSRDLFRAYSYAIGTFALGLDERGLARTFVREYELTVRQIVKQFVVKDDGKTLDWSTVSTTIKNLWDKGEENAAVTVVWTVLPNDYADTTRLGAKWLPFASCYFERDSSEKTFLRESGFKTFPIMAPRWDVTDGDTYGTDCPGMTALGDVKQLQAMHRKKGQAIAKMVDPPLVGPTALRTQKTSLLSGDITYVDEREGQKGLRSVHEVRIDLSHLKENIQDVRYLIQRAFYEDLFLMLARSDETRGAQPPTAREIDERHEEKLLALGPVLERTNDELLDPIVDRVFAMMLERGLLPPAPKELEGVDLKVEYVSILSQAQKLVGVVGQDRFLQTVSVLAQTFPEARHKVKVFETVDAYADMLGINPSLVATDAEAQGMVDAERQAQANAARAEQAVNIAKAGKLASDTPLSGDSMLNKIVGNATQPAGAVYSSPASPNPAPIPAPAGAA